MRYVLCLLIVLTACTQPSVARRKKIKPPPVQPPMTTPTIPTLPTAVSSMPYDPPVGGTTWNVTNTAGLTNALANCVYGDIISIAPGDYDGPFTVRNNMTGSGWLYIISSQLANLPAGTRVTPDDAANMPTLYGESYDTNPNMRPGLIINRGADRIYVAGIEVTTHHTGLGGQLQYAIFRIGEPATGSGTCDNIVIDRCYIHGTTTGLLNDGLYILNSTQVVVRECCIKEVHNYGESHGIILSDSPGPSLIHNNYVECAGIGIFIGDNVVTTDVEDVTVSRNHIFKPYRWYSTNYYPASSPWPSAQSGSTSSTIKLDNSASAVDGAYVLSGTNDYIVEIMANTGAGQWRVITNYVGSTRVATVTPNWTVTPDNTSTFRIRFAHADWIADPTNTDSVNTDWGSKNLFEIKACYRALVEGNTMEQSIYKTQYGGCMLYNAHGHEINDVTVRGNWCRQFNDGIQCSPGYYDIAHPVRRMLFEDNIFAHLPNTDDMEYFDSLYKLSSADTEKLFDITIRHNTMLVWGDKEGTYVISGEEHAEYAVGYIRFDGVAGTAPHVTRLLVQNELVSHGPNGITGNGQPFAPASLNTYVKDQDYLAHNIHFTDYPDSYNPYSETAKIYNWSYSDHRTAPAVGFTNTGFTAVGHFRLLESSAYETAASDGGPLGARIDNVLAYMGLGGSMKVPFIRP